MQKNVISLRQSTTNISLTAYRAIKILKLLLQKPCSHDDIVNYLQEDENTARYTSDDTVRITLNSLKAVGCDISRPTPSNNYKYILKSHPYVFNINKSQLKIISDIFKNLLKQGDWKLILDILEVLDKLSANFSDEFKNFKRPFAKVQPAVLKIVKDTQILNKELIITYFSSSAKTKQVINIEVQNIFSENGKIYIYAWYPKRNKYAYFNLEKISEIHSIKPLSNTHNDYIYKVVYKIKNELTKDFDCAFDEKILEKNNNEIIVEALVKSEFKIIQRLLSFGTYFEIIEPVFLKEIISRKITEIQEVYNDEE